MVSKDKAYIVTSKEQELKVLTKLEQEGYVWSGGEKPTEWVPSKHFITDDNFPIAIINDLSKHITFDSDYDDFNNEQYDIIYYGRKREEDNMSEKYAVSQEFMNTLNLWREKLPSFSISNNFVGPNEISTLPDVVKHWWCKGNNKENNNRLIAIIRWVNGEDVFEVEKPKKWVVRSKDCTEQGSYLYVMLDISHGVNKILSFWDKDVATRFDTKEEAQSWANSHQEVVEVEE